MVREAREEDLDSLMEIWLSGNLRAHAFVDPAYWEHHREEVRAALPQAEVLVAAKEETGEVQGFLGLVGTEVEGLFVEEASCHRGIGTALVDAAKRCHPVLTLCVYLKNAPALAFYQRQGFVPVREQTDPGTGEQEIRMRWEAAVQAPAAAYADPASAGDGKDRFRLREGERFGKGRLPLCIDTAGIPDKGEVMPELKVGEGDLPEHT